MSTPRFITPETRDELLAKADLLEVVQQHQELRRRGASYLGDCPSCGGKNGLNVSPAKGLVKCFKCNQGGAGPIAYLTELRGMKYVDACIWLADRYHIDIPTPDKPHHPRQADRPAPAHDTSFRDRQLRSSGIPEDAQQYQVTINGDTQLLSRYTAGSLDGRGMPTTGHDMLLHYLDLDGEPITYKHPTTKKDTPYIRVRHAFPELHLDREGKPIRYLSPREGGNHLWIPEAIRTAYRDKQPVDTLIFVEGEKKADALTCAGLHSVGIAGIHNFAASNEMPAQVERLISTLGVRNVVFWLDADLQDLGSDLTRADSRPKTFSRAVIKFRAYFYRFQKEGINLQSWLCHGTDPEHKGADDLLISITDQLGPAHPLTDDFRQAIQAHDGRGKHLALTNITSHSDYQITELWHLHSPKAFMAFHRERLKTCGEFRIKGIRYRWDDTAEDFVIAQKLMPGERYWQEIDGKFGPRLEFDHYNITVFLHNRGYSRYPLSKGNYRFIHTEDNIVTEVFPEEIRDFVYEFTKSIEEMEVLRMLYRGSTQYFGPDKLRNLPIDVPTIYEARRDQQIMCFRDCYWLITPDKITVHPHRDLPAALWRDDVIDFKPTLIEDFIKLEPGERPEDVTVEAKEDCDIMRYLTLTSDIHWREAHATATTFPEVPFDRWSDTDRLRYTTMMSCLADKIIATGYVASTHVAKSQCRAIITMDAMESESGKSEGRTGKSIWATQFEYLMPTVVIDAKKPRLEEDSFLYGDVDDRTKVIVFDDCRRSINFETFLSHITRGITANQKGEKRMFVGLKKLIFTTNHSIRGEDKSFVGRQYVIGFSDYFSPERTPYDIFKHELFTDWDAKQWNYWYNYMASSIQIYMRHGLATFAPDADIKRRKLRDTIGEDLMEIFETYFYAGSDFLNRRLELQKCLDAIHRQNRKTQQWLDKKGLKLRLRLYAQYAGYDYNLPTGGERMRNGTTNVEYFIISDTSFRLEDYRASLIPGHVTFDTTPDF